MTRMSRAHFRLIADVVKHLRTFEAFDAEMSEVVAHAVRKTDVMDRLASALSTTNRQFNRSKFFDACGLESTHGE